MATLHNIEGLMSWAGRAEWRAVLEEAVDRHTVQACNQAGIVLAGLGDVVGDDYLLTIWGAAFEDVVAAVQPDGRNLADDYLKRRGWKESVSTREYITGLRHAVISLYEVSGLVPGESMLLRDLVRPGEPVRVFEKSGSRTLRQWDRVATRVITLRGRPIISGTLLHFDHSASEDLLDQLYEPGPKRSRNPDAVLAESAFVFTNLWLAAALKAVQGRNRPQLMNSDGDPMEWTTLHFPLLPGVTAAQVRAALDGIPALRPESARFWNWLSPAKPKKGARQTNWQTFTTTMDDGAIVLGNVEIKGRRVSLMVNSQARAARGQPMLEAALAGLVRAPLTERADLDQMLAGRTGATGQPSGLLPEEERAVIQQTLDNHYRNVIDEPLPMLGNRSPRAVARTAKGREKVVEWLKLLENQSASRGPDDPMGGYDFGWIWRELGVEELRR